MSHQKTNSVGFNVVHFWFDPDRIAAGMMKMESFIFGWFFRILGKILSIFGDISLLLKGDKELLLIRDQQRK